MRLPVNSITSINRDNVIENGAGFRAKNPQKLNLPGPTATKAGASAFMNLGLCRDR